jgi:chromosome partitioning protein
MVISIVNVKGGVGKTTIAANLAAIFAWGKSKTMLVDVDPQQSAVAFGDIRAGLEEESKITSGKFSVASLTEKTVSQIKDYDHQIFIIDCGGSNNAALRKSISLSHLCIIPLQASAFDVLSTRKIISIIEDILITNPELKVRFLLNRLKPGVKANEDIETLFSDSDISFFNTRIYDRVAYQYSVPEGKSVLELDDDKAKSELVSLYNEINTLFKK